MRTLILASLIFAAPAAAAEQQFDLVCKGRQKTSALGSWKPYEQRYRIDLTAQAYCTFACKSVQKIKSVDAGQIVFQATDSHDPSGMSIIHYVDRTDGKWVYFLSGGLGLYQNSEGTCEPAAFSGFPAAKF